MPQSIPYGQTGSWFSMQVIGYQQLQAGIARTVESIRPGSGLGKAVQEAMLVLFRHTVSITHVETGALRASHYPQMIGAAEGRITISTATKNPLSGISPSLYGPLEHARGGSHAFYERTLAERGEAAADRGIQLMLRSMP